MNNLKTWMDVPGYWTEFDWRDYEHLFNELPEGGIMVEVGCNRGRSIISVGGTIKRKNLSVTCVDIFDIIKSSNYEEPGVTSTSKGMYQDFIDNISLFQLSNNVSCLVGKSIEVANNFHVSGDKFDMVFIDSDHSYEHVRDEIKSWWPLIKEGGILAFHDYDHNGIYWDGVYKAIHEVFGQPKFGVHIAAIRKINNQPSTNKLWEK